MDPIQNRVGQINPFATETGGVASSSSREDSSRKVRKVAVDALDVAATVPQDIMELIFSKLDVPDLTSCAQVHSVWHKAAARTYFLEQRNHTVRALEAFRQRLPQQDAELISGLDQVLEFVRSFVFRADFSTVHEFQIQTGERFLDWAKRYNVPSYPEVNFPTYLEDIFHISSAFRWIEEMIARNSYETGLLCTCFDFTLRFDRKRCFDIIEMLPHREQQMLLINRLFKETIKDGFKRFQVDFLRRLQKYCSVDLIGDVSTGLQEISKSLTTCDPLLPGMKQSLLLSMVWPLLMLGRMDEAVQKIDEFLATVVSPTEIEQNIERVRDIVTMLCTRGQFQRALSFSQTLSALAPAVRIPMFELLVQYCLEKRFLQKAFEILPEGCSAPLLRKLAGLLIKEGMLHLGAQIGYNMPAGISRDTIFSLLSTEHKKRKEYEKALFFAVETSDGGVDNIEIAVALVAWLQENQDKEVLQAIQQIPQDSKQRICFSYMINNYFGLHREDEALAVLRMVPAHIRPLRAPSLRGLFERFFSLQQYEKAEEIASCMQEPNRSRMLARIFVENYFRESMGKRLFQEIQLETLQADVREEVLRLKAILDRSQ